MQRYGVRLSVPSSDSCSDVQVYCWAPAQISVPFFRRHGADEINRGLLFLLYYVCFYKWVNKDEYKNR